MECEKCGKTTDYANGYCGDNIKGFDRLIFLCEDCDKKWGKVWAKSGIKIKFGGFSVQYQKAYYDLFWNWFNHTSKEKVNFT